MSKAIWLLVYEDDWGGTRRLDKETMEMVDTIHTGSQINLELIVSLQNAWLTQTDPDEPAGSMPGAEPVIESRGEGLPICHFLGRVLKVFPGGLIPNVGPPLRGVAYFHANMDCGLPVCLTGPSGAGDTLADMEGKWVEGTGVAAGNPTQPLCPLAREVRGVVKDIRETSASALLHGRPWVDRIIEFEPIARDQKPLEDQG